MRIRKRTLFLIGLLIVAAVALYFSWYAPNGDSDGAVVCLEEQRDVDACIEIYQPVCGSVEVECVRAPCDPVWETFENSCRACSNERVVEYIEGEC
jgi:hypothetical protein